ncbi:MAG TPA: cytochrome c biogenesis protein CcsA [Gemmatimonadaceae bacterium]|jgi:heme exporter protein C
MTSSSADKPRWLVPLGVVGFAAVGAAQLYGILMSPPDRDMGHLQKIMYVHVPAAWMAFICFFIVLVESARYLWRGRERHDLLAAAAAETGAMLTALTLMLGSIWGRPTWGVWWTWDARLTSTAVLLVVFVGYLVLRAFTDDPIRRARWSAAIGILGALNVPIVYMSVKWWRTLHQLQSSPRTFSPEYTRSLRLNAIAALVLVVWFIAWRYHIARIERAIDDIDDARALGDTSAKPLETRYA